MIVTVRDRKTEDAHWGGPGPFSVVARKVEIADTCPACGGPRGEASGYNGCEDGDYYWVNVWSNACGHIDSYPDVLAEAAALRGTTA
jgi:hypothetical protein